MIKPILFAPGSTDPVFWALKEINIYKLELYKIKEEFRMRFRNELTGDSLTKTMQHIYNQVTKLDELISIGMNGRAIDNKEAQSPYSPSTPG